MKKEALLPKLKRMIRSHIELKLIFCGSDALSLFLAAPIAMLLLKSFQSSGGAFWTILY